MLGVSRLLAGGMNLTFESRLARELALKCQIQKLHSTHKIARGPLIPAFALERAASGGKCRNRTTSVSERPAGRAVVAAAV
jgi:hypothetical protein